MIKLAVNFRGNERQMSLFRKELVKLGNKILTIKITSYTNETSNYEFTFIKRVGD